MVGDVLNEAFDLYKAHWKHLVGIALVFYLVASAVTLLLSLVLGVFGAIAGALILLIGIFWLTGALIEAVADVRDGRADLTIRQTFSRVGQRVLPLLGASILLGLGVAFGLLLLIVPGLILLTRWSLVPAAVVLERRGVFESFGRSNELVRGSGWSVFGVIVITWILSAVVSGVIGAILSPLPDYVGQYLANVAGGAVTAPFSALAITIVYFRLSGAAAMQVALPEPEPR